MAHILFRGQYDKPKGQGRAGHVPPCCTPMPADAPQATGSASRSGWCRRSNPLTARVTVNRFWQEVFGTGLVKTPEDFGIDGRAAVAIRNCSTGWRSSSAKPAGT